MQDIPMRNTVEEQDYQAGFAKVMWFAERAKSQGWKFTDRQLVHEIIQRERAARIREKSSLPLVHAKTHSAAWNRGQADALRALLRLQRERYGS